jgi:3-methylcrotonyl-CoA carboxylase alpha subunit
MFDKILIANRGEIACRVIATARRLGVATVAVYVPVDAASRWVDEADEAYEIPTGSYLDGAALIDLARRAGAAAIHPGYGFLSENASFARDCKAAGIVFIGADPHALATMGSKSAAKALLQDSGIPLLPGYHGEDQSEALLAREAARIGFPVLIKASAGGGGKGMRVVETADALAEALAACRREALAAFGDDRVLIEKYLTAPRHIELQIFADRHGQCIHLFERDCSVQRRHQKVLEEAPAPGLSPERRAHMGETACRVARAVDYLGAGTVEFIVDTDSGEYYFMEMNTRLQVEHPVTEMITGLDLVELQLRVACGEPLPLRQETLRPQGHAIEARLYAEDPEHGFLPACGTLVRFQPPVSDGIRVDSGFRQGDTASPHFDPMLAKLIAHGSTREEALARLARALADFRLAGVANNLAFLRRLVTHPAFVAGMVDTGFIPRHQAMLLPPPAAPLAEWLALLLLDEALPKGEDTRPWTRLSGWRAGPMTSRLSRRWRAADGDWHEAVLESDRSGFRVIAGARRLVIEEARRNGETLHVRLDGKALRATVARHGAERMLFLTGGSQRFEAEDPLACGQDGAALGGHLRAPMPGRIVSLCVSPGARVGKGTALLIMEAMKMEHTLHAPSDGHVGAYHFQAGDQVEEGADLLDFEPEAAA